MTRRRARARGDGAGAPGRAAPRAGARRAGPARRGRRARGAAAPLARAARHVGAAGRAHADRRGLPREGRRRVGDRPDGGQRDRVAAGRTQRQVVRSVFLRLTELGEGVAETRRRVAIDELVPEGASPEPTSQALLERLADARLVTLGEGTAEVAHEVLIREWPTLRGWLEEDREGLRLHRQTRARPPGSGTRRARAVRPVSRHAAAAPPSSGPSAPLRPQHHRARFIDAERRRRPSANAHAQLRSNRRLRGLLAGAVAPAARRGRWPGVVALDPAQATPRRRR